MPGRRILVTGAARRVGKVIADALEAEGARVWRHTRAQGDLEDPVACERIVREAASELGGLDGLVLSASIFHKTPLAGTPPQDLAAAWDRFLAVNARSVFVMCATAAGLMQEGAIVVIGDGATARPTRQYTPYAVSKAVLRPLVGCLAIEWAPRIRVNLVESGPVLPPEGLDEAGVERLRALQPLQRIGRPENLLPSIRDALTNDFMTGAVIRIDGGRGL